MAKKVLSPSNDFISTLNSIPNTLTEISFAKYTKAIYYDEFELQDFEYHTSQARDVSFLNGIDPKLSLVPIGEPTRRISNDQCICFKNILTFDLDGKDINSEFKLLNCVEQKNLLSNLWKNRKAQIEKYKIPLWMVVFSGHGLHLHFKLSRPLAITDKHEYKRLYNCILEFLSSSLDMVFDKNCANPARIIRLPLSTNYKDQSSPKTTEIWYHNHDSFADAWLNRFTIPLSQKTPKSQYFTNKESLLEELDLFKIFKHFHYSKLQSIEERSDKLICSSPFNNDSTPSFHYNKEKRQFFDFSTGKGGDLFHLIAYLAGLDCRVNFPQVIEIAEIIAGLGAKKPNIKTDSNSYFDRRNSGVWHITPQKDSEPEEVWICGHLTVLANSRDHFGDSWGKVLVFKDSDGKEKNWAMPMEYLAGDGIEIRKQLLGMGLDLSTNKKARNLLQSYIQETKVTTKARCLKQIGWIGDIFALPDECISSLKTHESIVYQGQRYDHKSFSTSGSLVEWQEHVAKPCMGQSRLEFILAFAFAPPLLSILGLENGGINITGPSSIGKSIALKIAASVWGYSGINGLVQKWRSTVNGLESLAESRNDSLLILDELGEISAKEAGYAVYMLGNGSGKVRANRYGDAREVKEWRCLYLSSGEISLKTHLGEENKIIRGGQEVRFVDLEADAGQNLGICDFVPSGASIVQYIDKLRTNSEKFFGTAIRSFLRQLVHDPDATQRINSYYNECLDKLSSSHKNPQVLRIIKRFALVYAAGNLACCYGVLPFSDVNGSIITCFNSWLIGEERSISNEDRELIAQIRMFIEKYSLSHFPLFSSLSREYSGGFYGFRKEVGEGKLIWYISNEIFKQMACKGFNIRTAIKILSQHDLIELQNGNRSSVTMRIPSLGVGRYYPISSKILDFSS